MRWLELEKDYGGANNYHPDKANMVVDALSHKTQFKLGSLLTRDEGHTKDFCRISLEVV